MIELENYIQMYFGIEDQHLRELTSMFEKREMKKGDFLTEIGARRTHLNFIKSGFMRVYAIAPDGKEVTQWISVENELVTDLSSLIFDIPVRWNIQALTNCEIYSLPFSSYRKMDTIVPDWHKLEKLFLSKCFLTMEDRIFTFLSQSAEERYVQFSEKRKDLMKEIPLHFLASMLGMTPETMSRVRKKIGT